MSNNDVAKHCVKCDRPDTADHLVGCDRCDTWMHFDCAGVTDSIADSDRSWKCDQCRLREDDAISQTRQSIGRSSTSKRSAKVELSLQMVEEQKALHMKRILEEQAAEAATRQKLAEAEEKFLKQKYDVLRAEADDIEEGTSRRTRLSSRASREKVQSWLNEHQAGAVQQVTVAPASRMSPTVVIPGIVHQSSVPQSTGPTATSTMDDSAINASDVAEPVIAVTTTVPHSHPTKYLSDKVISSTEITFERRPVSTSKTSRCGSTIHIDPVGTVDPIASKTVSNSNYNSVPIIPTLSVSIPNTSLNNKPMLVNSIPSTSLSNTPASCCAVVLQSASGHLSSSVSKMSNSQSAGLYFRSGSEVNRENINSTADRVTLLAPNQIQSVADGISLLHSANTRPIQSVHNVALGIPPVVVPVTVPYPPPSTGIENVIPSWSCWNPISATSQAGPMRHGGGTIVSGMSGFSAPTGTFNDPVTVSSSIALHRGLQGTDGISSVHPAGFSRYFRHPMEPPISYAQPSTTMMRGAGPSSEQLAARQVMPKDLPNFSGDPQEWPLFHSSFCNSTEACGYTDSENLARLQRCLKGNALEAVRSRLLMPQSVPAVIDTLRRLYGRPEILIHSLLQKLRAVPSPKVDNLESLITFGLAVQNAVDHMSIANLNNHLWNPTLLCELVEKLPPQLKMEWSSFMRSSTNVNLATFGAFMSELVMMASDVTLPGDMVGVSAKPFKTRREKQKLYVHSEEIRTEKADSSVVKSVTEPVKKTCTYCSCVNHEIVNCTQFKALDMDGRWKAIKQKNLCRSCLIPHKKWPCRSNRECGVDGCRVHHHMLLHSTRNLPYKGETANKSQSTSNVKSIVHQNLHSSIAYSLFRYLPITIHANGQQMKSFAFLDDGSSSTLLDSSIAMALGITGPTDNFSLSWTSNISREEKGSQRVTVVISGDRKQFKLNNVRTVQELRLPCQTMQYEELQQIHPHLKGLPIRSYKEATPGIIIGLEHVRLLTSLRVREGGDNEPVATKTRLGWCIFGKSSADETVLEQLNFHHSNDLDNRELHERMRHYFAIEESSVTIKPECKDDKRAREIMETTTRRVNGSFETGLLWKFDSFSFPDSYPMAVRRMKALEKRFSKDPVLAGKVRETITQYESKGYARLITSEELQSTDPSKVWYLPLGVVQNPKKPNKIRLIWDAKARAGGVSFNDMLMPGPDLLVALVAVLLRFRQRNIAVVGDIREMFHQILIRNEDKQSQRFLYRPSEELSPQIYVMNVATFGATCSPSLAQFVKNKNASEFAERFPRAAKAIIENHYVDDFLDSLDSEAEAIQLVNEVKYVHSQAGFEIRNFCSNSTKVLAAIGEQKASSSVSLNLEKALGTERVLGMIWKPTEDVFTFDPSTLNEDIKALIGGAVTPTKRQVLKTIMSLFDPLGLISHFVVHGKILMQLIWRSGTDWDESIPEELRAVWSRWCQHLQRLDIVAVPRCFFKGIHSSTLDNLEAHLFVDASELACAAVLYLRLVNNNKVRCTLVAAKTKVAPLKPVSVPRLELQAAMIGVRMMDTVLVSLDIPVIRRFLWSDSSTVLSWLRSDSRRFHQFVAVRVGEILSTTSVDEWHYVPSKLNAADAATKWKDEPIFADNNTWYNAPDFLYKSPEHWPSKLPKKELETVSELRAVFLFHGMEQKPLLDVSRFSNWNRLVRTVGYTIRAIRRFKGEKHHDPAFLAQEELKYAEILLWRQIQNEAYADEGSILKHNRAFPEDPLSIPSASPLYRLSPFIDEDGVIRMDSRITAAPMIPLEVKYPILLPKKHAAVILLVGEYHRRFLHANGETVCNEMRQKFFIPGLRSLIRQVSKSCLHCRIKKATPQPPMMASLPEARVTGFVRPFTHTGVDYFGPVMVKQGRSLVKRWVALFTCLAIRAIHLELVYNLSTQSCIMAIRRFVARRGFPEAFYSDNGTNFVGASNLLTKQIHEDCAVTFISAKTRWCFNPPSAPHMGGSWERMVRSVKAAISVIADHPHHPSDEVFQTVILEAEATVNSRPLTYIPLECSEQAALTPNHFLLFGTKGVVQPELVINPNLNTLRDSWRLAQTLVNHFWTRWVREYLPMITRRTKWFKPTKPLESGDLVIVVEDGKRNGWLRGQVVDVMKAADGQVRRAVVKTKNGLVTRPAVKLAILDLQVSASSGTTRAGGCFDTTGHSRCDVVTE